jgi:tRNA uridine 5-carboxymethylaminomethyl modification enzyme
VTIAGLTDRCAELATLSREVVEQIEYDLKYQGYITRQDLEIERTKRLAERVIPTTFDYSKIGSLRTEAKEKLTKVRPLSIAQASRISGITPADVALLMIHLD